MAARPKESSPVQDNAYEREREERIRRNKAKMVELGIPQQKTLFEASFKIVKTASQPMKLKEKVPGTPSRSSCRLKGSQPVYTGLTDDFHDGLQDLPRLKCTDDEKWTQALQARRCDSQGRGSVYDSKLGITCHFCRQKKLCGEADCQRCSERNPEHTCKGKSECCRCGSGPGRFCRACLLIRYGQKLEAVREEMQAGTWICAHCYEEDHPDEGWICNSSICMTRRGLKPTGIAIYDAQKQGFASVAHYVQARIMKQKTGKMSCSQGAKENERTTEKAVSAEKTDRKLEVKSREPPAELSVLEKRDDANSGQQSTQGPNFRAEQIACKGVNPEKAAGASSSRRSTRLNNSSKA